MKHTIRFPDRTIKTSSLMVETSDGLIIRDLDLEITPLGIFCWGEGKALTFLTLDRVRRVAASGNAKPKPAPHDTSGVDLFVYHQVQQDDKPEPYRPVKMKGRK